MLFNSDNNNNLLLNKIVIIIFANIIIIIDKKSENNYLKEINTIPKVSVFLPIYNKGSFLYRSINSIQRQNMKEIEIIAINDGSTDSSLKILKKLAKRDNRIKIFNNDRNHGLLYSRAMGITNSSGEYIMNLDPDDKLFRRDNLKSLYDYSKKLNLDYLRYLQKRIARDRNDINFCKTMDTLQLNTTDYYITNKFIKRNVIINAYNIFKNKIYSNKWNYHEDNIWSFLLKKYSNSTKIIHKIIYVIIRNKESLTLLSFFTNIYFYIALKFFFFNG